MKFVSHQDAVKLLHNKFVVVLGDSIQRGVYKDIVLLLQKETFLSNKQLKTKGEMSFEQDRLVEGGTLKPMNNGTEYQESVLNDFSSGLKPDVVIVNSCVWDITRYDLNWLSEYERNLKEFFTRLREVLPRETLTMWSLTMPLGQDIKGGFLTAEMAHKAPRLRHDVINANFLSCTVANSFQVDILDLHFHFRHALQHRTSDGIHWNPLAHRCMTSLLLLHAAQAWGVVMPDPLSYRESLNSKEFTKDSPASKDLSFKENVPQPVRCKNGREKRPPLNPSRWNQRPPANRNARFQDFTSWLANYLHDNRGDHHHHDHPQQQVMRNQHRKTYYRPYF